MPTQRRAFGRSQNLIERARNSEGVRASPQSIDRKKIRWWIDTYFGKSNRRFAEYLRALSIDLDSFMRLIQSEQQSSGLYKIKKRAKRNFSANHKIPDYENGGIGKLCSDYIGLSVDEFCHFIYSVSKNGITIDQQCVVSAFRKYLYVKIADLLIPALILETNIYRLTLSASYTSEERFKLFVSSLSIENNKKRFWSKYPVLQRKVITVAKNTTRMAIETISRLERNRKRIENVFGIKHCDALKTIDWGSGDSHCRGRVVAILHFKNKKLVYKPRSIKADKAYNHFLDWYGKVCNFSSPPTYQLLDLKEYGYTEFIRYKKASSKKGIASYYHKQGQLITIAWLLGITDLHHENLIASGNDPYLIDLETMFDRPYRQTSRNQTLGLLYNTSMDVFLFRTGLLPNRRRGEHGVYDTSAIGASGKQPAPFAIPTFKNLGRDDIRIVPKMGTISRQLNKPTLAGYNHHSHQYTKEIVRGFINAFDVFLENRDQLLGENGPLSFFKEARFRWVPRDTVTYERIIQRLKHPTVLRDAIESDMLLGGSLLGHSNSMPHLRKLIKSEVTDLWNNDIPYFSTTFNTRSLYDSHKNEIKDFFSVSCIENVSHRLKIMEKSKFQQAEAIKLAMSSTIYVDDIAEAKEKKHSFLYKKRKISDDEIISASVNIGKELLDKKLDIKGMPFWAGLMAIDDASYTASVLQPTLYDGTIGIGVFLAELYRCTRIDVFKDIALEVHNFVRALIHMPTYNTNCGAFSGYGGLLYADILMSLALKQPPDDKKGAIASLEKLIEKDDNLDVMAGAAGALLVATRYYSKTKDPMALETAAKAVQKLKRTAMPQKVGIAWNTLKDSNYSRPLGGLSHGVTGIAWALSEWAEISKDAEIKFLVDQAFAYEQALFDKQNRTWIDARHKTSVCHWCHGSVGIGLAINKMRTLLSSQECDKIVALAQEATWEYGITGNHCLCHGNLGNSELFLALGEYDRSSKILSNIFADYKKHGYWRCGMPSGVTTPGLMCGLSGIGYGLLRHAYPENVPNILTLET